MTPDERAARLHLTDAAESLRVAGERLCDWLEATGQDVAGNGHVASADEAAGSFREAPTAPVSSSPPPIPLDRAAIAREVLTELAEAMGAEGNGGGGRVLRFRDEQFPPPSPVPPPIPLGAVVTVTVNGVEWQREDGEWDDAEGGGPPNKADALDFLDRIAELERERDEARRALAAAQGKALEFDRIQRACPAGVDAFDHMLALEDRLATAERERYAARRELAARDESTIAWSGDGSLDDPSDGYTYTADAVRQFILHAKASAERQSGARLNDSVVSENAPLSGAGNMADSGNQAPAPASAPCGHTNTSPSPDSPHARVAAPRRWWLRRRSDAGWPDAHAYLSEEMARSALYGPTGGGWSDVVPVLEARVTRETVERVVKAMRDDPEKIYHSMARAALTALGLTVEG